MRLIWDFDHSLNPALMFNIPRGSYGIAAIMSDPCLLGDHWSVTSFDISIWWARCDGCNAI